MQSQNQGGITGGFAGVTQIPGEGIEIYCQEGGDEGVHGKHEKENRQGRLIGKEGKARAFSQEIERYGQD